ncbi:hypothetical protein WISP_70881 [Willisornis vidua]|uniref:Beta/gamma crystallin 'Greek key' domain-containing protein n=1 Tax=Willisornis vidua TaxID=1566151 RepID=A0ABQ9D7J5_9PASS|nr:hypothetical protein WISP_70881 [Willisornis vidua]
MLEANFSNYRGLYGKCLSAELHSFSFGVYSVGFHGNLCKPGQNKACPNEEKNHSTEELSKSEIQEELKKANSLPSLTPGVKTAEKDKQPREGFFHFLGSLFNIATKSSLVESKPSTLQDEPTRCEKDLQNTNTLPKDMQPKHPKIEPLCSTAWIKEDSVNKRDGILNNIGREASQDLQGGRKQSADTQNVNCSSEAISKETEMAMQEQRFALITFFESLNQGRSRQRAEPPAVTYATYRGSARIRQLLRSQSETTGKGEEGPENRNASAVKENGEIQRTPSVESGRLTEGNGRGGKDHEDDVPLNPSAVRMGSKDSGKAQHCLGRSKHEIPTKATTSSCHELDSRHSPALAATKVKRTRSLDSFLPFSSRNSEILTNSTAQMTHSLRVSSANGLVGREDGLPGGAGALLQTNKNATGNLDKEDGCGKAAKESPKEIQDDCLHSPKSQSKTVHEELQVGEGEFCCNHQMDNHSEQTLGVQMLHFSTKTFQEQAHHQTGSANRESHPRKNGPQNIEAAVEREQNPQNFPATVPLAFNEQISTSLGVESKEGQCMATGHLTASVSSVGHDRGRVMGRDTCKELSELRKAVPVQNGHKLIHVENSEDTQQTGWPCLETEDVETVKVLPEVAVEDVADVSSCVHGCQSVKANPEELTEEMITKQALGVCQPCGGKDGLENRVILNYQKAETVQLEGEETQSAVQSLKDFNESIGGGSSSFTGNERGDTNNQDEKILSCIPDKADLDSALALKAKETVEGVINSAIQKLASRQWQGTERKRPSEEVGSKPKAEMPKALNLDMKFPAKTQEPAEVKETQCVSVNCAKADCSGPPLLPNGMANGMGWPQRDENTPNNVITCQTNGFLPTGSLTSPESDLTTPPNERHNSEHVAAELCDKAGVAAVSRKSDGSLHFVHRDAAVSEEMLLSLQLKGSCNNTNMPECTLLPTASVHLSSSVPDEDSVGMQSESKDESIAQVSLQSSAEDRPHEHCRAEAAKVVPAQVKVTLEGSKVVENREERAGGPSERAEVDNGLGTAELSVPAEDSEGKKCFNTVFAQNSENLEQANMKDQHLERSDQLEKNGLNCRDDMKESAELLASSPLIEQWDNSSFTIIYEGALQTENKSVSTDDAPAGSLPSPGSPPDSAGHLRCDRGKQEPASVCGQDPQPSEAAEGRGSEPFLSVEAKRYRVYPFSLSPIYEDDSAQEDLLSTDVSPESHPKDSSDHASVLSLLQSVSERLQFTARFSEEEEEEEDGVEEEEEESSYEENVLDVEKEDDCLSSQWRGSLETTLQLNDQHRSLLPEQSFLRSKEQLGSQEQPEQLPDGASPAQSPCKPVPEKADAAPTHPPTSVYYQYLKSASSSSSEKGTRFGSILQDMLQPKIHWCQDNAVPKLGELSVNLIDRTSLKCNPRPGKIIIYDTHGSQSKQEVHSDVPDTSSWIFPTGALLRIIRGCWIFYEKPKFQGRKHVLEEGEAVLDHLWDLPGVKHRPRNLTVGSIRHVTKDCGIPEVEFCPAAGGTEGPPVCIQAAIPSLEELDVEKNPYLRVKSGVWLAYSDLNYKGEMTVLEECDSPSPSADVKSLRPLKMGGLKVQMPMNVKIIIYEKTHFGGWSKEISENITSVPALFGSDEEFQAIGSIRVIGGVWVAYAKERYKGHQFLLEEGDYADRHSWGGQDSVLLSFRFLQADFIESSVALFQSDDEDGKALDISNEEIPDLEKAGYGPETRSILVRSGVNHLDRMSLHICWLLYYQGETSDNHCVLEEGLYADLSSCGCPTAAIKALKPIQYVFAEPSISLFTQECCKGRELHFSGPVNSVLNEDLHFYTQSVWVRSGLWIAYEGCSFLGKQILLEPSEISNWSEHSGWKVIGSLRPVKQANNACLDVIGGRDVPGAKVALWAEHGKDRQKWRLNEDGTISSYLSEQLVLDIKGGNYYDKNHIIMNQPTEDRLSQKWDIEIL